MTSYRRGDIVYVPFLFTDKDVAKNRPVVIISSESYNGGRHEVLIGGVTSNVTRNPLVGQMDIKDWQKCGLVKPSVVSGIIQTVKDTQLGRRVGELTERDRLSLDAALREALGL